MIEAKVERASSVLVRGVEIPVEYRASVIRGASPYRVHGWTEESAKAALEQFFGDPVMWVDVDTRPA